VDKHAYKPAIEQAIWQPEARQVIKNMLLRLFSASFIASMSDQEQRSAVYNIYGLCRLQANINKNNLTHSFCSFFTKNSELEYFSWEEDALNYFSKGYAGSENNVAHNVACALVGNFIATSDEAIKSPKTAPIAHLRFAHAETIIPFLVQLGLYSSDSVSTMLQNASERKFRTTEISPMAANVQWILYQCPNNNYRVQMLHNEVAKSFPMPGCESKTSCDYRLVKNYLEQQKLSCDAERWANEVCKGVSCTR
jgi:hypothetical protein